MGREVTTLIQEVEIALAAVLAFDESGKTRNSAGYKFAVNQCAYTKEILKTFVKTMRSPKHWTSQDGRVIAIKDLEDSHLGNILRMLKRNAQAVLRIGLFDEGDFPDEWLDAFEDYELQRVKNLIKEAKKRKLTWDWEG